MLGMCAWFTSRILASKAIFSIACGIETPLSLDDYTMKKTRGFFIWVLVDVKPSLYLALATLVKCPSFAFMADIKYERLPPFYSFSKMIGHEFSFW